MRFDPTCPIEIINIELMRDDRGHVQAYLYARCGLCCAPVLVEGFVRWSDPASGAFKDNSFSMQPEGVAPGSRFPILVSESFMPEDVRLTVCFTRVELADGLQWTGSIESMRRYPEIPHLEGAAANALCAAAGKDAVCCAWELDTGDWQCVCGRWNDAQTESCMRCGRDRADTLELFHPDAVDRLAPAQGPLEVDSPIAPEPEPVPPAPAKDVRMKRILAAVFAAAVFA
ncbi:MAG: hypothetical protein Q4A66_03975, partial [Eubacteriales bacterium]|nr:hypothetical protein [Eubacteriales bacterium]